MTEQHECEWIPIDTNFGEIEEAEWFVCEHYPAILSREDVIARLNEYKTLKKATEALSAVDASWCAGVLMEATNNHGVEQKFNRNPYYLADVLKAYADILEGK